jgi:hypothetical protein
VADSIDGRCRVGRPFGAVAECLSGLRSVGVIERLMEGGKLDQDTDADFKVAALHHVSRLSFLVPKIIYFHAFVVASRGIGRMAFFHHRPNQQPQVDTPHDNRGSVRGSSQFELR